MKAKKFTTLILLIATLGGTVSCGSNRRLALLTMEQRETLDYLERNKLEDIKDTVVQVDLEESEPVIPCNTACCENIKFCGLTKDDLLRYITNYRDTNWFYTSPFFEREGISNIADVPHVVQQIAEGTYSNSPSGAFTDPTSDVTNFDSRFMDVPIEQLENYLCHLKNNYYTSQANTCRFYFLRYDNTMGTHSNKTSLAIVPVKLNYLNGNYITEVEYTNSYISDPNTAQFMTSIFQIGGIGASGQCENTPMANHNHLCPPLKNCSVGTLILEADVP